MKLLLLRGNVPTDRPSSEICFDTITAEDDVYTHLAYRIGARFAEIVYEGARREQMYTPNCVVRWVPSFETFKPIKEPNAVWCRGGFASQRRAVKRWPNAVRFYYGAGRRHVPDSKVYDFSLQDSIGQALDAKKRFPNMLHEVWEKPAAPHFRPMEVRKKYDICYIANGTQAYIKRIKWVYWSCPRDVTILHLGMPSKYRVPPNVTCKRVSRTDMPKYINQCNVGIVPYKSIDSCPRALVEMSACGLPVVALPSVKFCGNSYPSVVVATKDQFWGVVRGRHTMTTRHPTIERTVDHLRRLIKAAKQEKE